jgi:2-polyprenyl-6-methoxyphenol hydroxylase-like FAD-dependent oxidoreductase
MLVALGSGKGILIQRQGDGHYRMYFAVAVEEDFTRSGGAVDLSDIEAARGLFLSQEFYADWAEEFKHIIRHARDFYSWPLYYTPPETINWKSVPGMTLAGDAAHTSTPFAGEGVNCAMTDARELASKIIACGTGDMGRAVREYEEGMFARGIDLIERSARNGELMFHHDGPADLVQSMHGGLFSG